MAKTKKNSAAVAAETELETLTETPTNESGKPEADMGIIEHEAGPRPYEAVPPLELKHLEYLTVRELLEYENMARIVCSRFESEMRNYDGTIKPGSDHNAFQSCITAHRLIVDEMERRLR